MVWDAFTKQEILDQWTVPAPYLSKTIYIYMNFEVGGKRFYAMVVPDGNGRRIIQKYTSISPKTYFKLWNAFADKERIRSFMVLIGIAPSANKMLLLSEYYYF